MSSFINEYRGASYSDIGGGAVKKWEDYDYVISPSGKKIDMNELLNDQYRAKNALVHLIPYFGEFVGKFRFIYTFRIPTQATDGRDIFINPEFTSELDFTGKVFVMAHEVMHCILNHLRRAKAIGADMTKANIAADYECNITLAEMDAVRRSPGLNDPDQRKVKPLVSIETMEKHGALVDKKYSGWGFEKIYKDNPSGPTDRPKPPSGSQSPMNRSKDWVDGWNKAIEDYKNGKLKL